MNHITPPLPRDLQALQTRFALKIAARLSQQADDMPHDLSERLRFARERALDRAQEVRRAAPAVAASSSLLGRGVAGLLGGNGSPWWLKLASALPLVLLLAGLSAIEELHDRTQINTAAEIDVALLSDALPPDAYRDAGFVEYLKTSQE